MVEVNMMMTMKVVMVDLLQEVEEVIPAEETGEVIVVEEAAEVVLVEVAVV